MFTNLAEIQLTENEFLSEGFMQRCYVHPLNEKLCIKIPKEKNEKLSNEIAYLKGLNKRISAYSRVSFVSLFKGEIRTNLGKGYVYQLVRDEHNGRVSKPLSFYLENPLEWMNENTFQNAFNCLVQKMILYKVNVEDFYADNICCKIGKDGKSIQLVLIDGLANKEFIPISNYFRFLARQKIKRKLRKFRWKDISTHQEFAKDNERKKNSLLKRNYHLLSQSLGAFMVNNCEWITLMEWI